MTTLSSGEIHRLALAMVLVDKPQWLVLDDTFAALDPAMREVAGRHVAREVPHCSLIITSDEYVPVLFTGGEETRGQGAYSALHTPEPSRVQTRSDRAGDELPHPDPKNATLWRTVGLLFGPHILTVIIGAAVLVGLEIAFAQTLSKEGSLTPHLAIVSAMCALAVVVGCVLFFGAIYRVPIARLGRVHRHLLDRFDQFATRQRSGAIVGRMGEDFSNLQMDVPGAIGSVFRTIIYTVLLVGAATAGAPILLLVILVILPLAYLAYRYGSKRVLTASTRVANEHGEFLGAVGVQAGLHTGPVSPRFREAGQAAYVHAESAYLAACVAQANAYAWRNGLIQALVLCLNIAAVTVAVVFGAISSLVAPAAVIYFAITLSSGVKSTIETLQDVGVVGLTAERVRALETLTVERALPQIRQTELDQAADLLDSGRTMIALIGPTGAGKSVILEALAHRYPKKDVCIIPDVDPFAAEGVPTSGLDLAREELTRKRTRFVLLDETFKVLTPKDERKELINFNHALAEQNRQAIVVLHSRSNLDIFTDVIELGR